MTIAHALSVDVEDWFQVLNMAHRIDRSQWESFELRCVDSTRKLLDLFARRGLRQQEARGFPGCIYLHPWEVDPDQPRQPLGGLRGFRHYVNLGKTLAKLDRLLGDFRFTTVSGALGQFGASWTAKLPTLRASELLG